MCIEGTECTMNIFKWHPATTYYYENLNSKVSKWLKI